jgi:hypothetical protein
MSCCSLNLPHTHAMLMRREPPCWCSSSCDAACVLCDTCVSDAQRPVAPLKRSPQLSLTPLRHPRPTRPPHPLSLITTPRLALVTLDTSSTRSLTPMHAAIVDRRHCASATRQTSCSLTLCQASAAIVAFCSLTARPRPASHSINRVVVALCQTDDDDAGDFDDDDYGDSDDGLMDYEDSAGKDDVPEATFLSPEEVEELLGERCTEHTHASGRPPQRACGCVNGCVCVCVHTHTHTHARAHTHSHTHTHSLSNTRKH